MNNSVNHRLPSLMLLPCLTFIAPGASAFELPDCEALQAWSADYVPDETVSLAPKVTVTTLLKDEKTVPLFGQPVQAWSANDMGALRKALRKCRSAARKNKPVADRLYKALKAIDAARGQLNRALQVGNRISQTVERLVQYRPSPRLAGQLALSQEALQGREPDLAAHGLQRMPNWIASFQQAPDYLNTAEIETHVATLAAREAELNNQFESLAADYAAAKKELAQAPLTAAGMQTVDRLERLPWLKQLTPQQQDAFRNDINRKRMAYTRVRRSQQVRQQPARAPGGSGYGKTQRNVAATPDLKAYLDEVLRGDEVEALSLKGLVPGITEQQGVHRAVREWGFKQTVNLALKPAYGKKGVMLEFRTMEDDVVGEVDFTVRFKTLLNKGQALAMLKERFGDPDRVEQVPAGQRLTWEDGDRVLQVVAANRVNYMYRGYTSRLALALWSSDYEDYVEQVNERCDELREKPMSELSVSDKVHMAEHCSFGMGSKQKPGLKGAL